jgi:PIN domain nuclease of toxin-antitoxin system
MNLLLDTHAFIWWRVNDPRIRRGTRQIVASADRVFVSLVSAWEAAIKVGLGRLRIPEPFKSGIEKSGFEPLPIAFSHVERVAELPHHHGDPFDRMLIAQAMVEGLTVVTGDRRFSSYGVQVVDA